jgi:hypothetical protein
MTSNGNVKDFFKRQTLKQPKLVQLDMVLYKWFTAVHSKGKHMTWPVTSEEAMSFHDELKITDQAYVL